MTNEVERVGEAATRGGRGLPPVRHSGKKGAWARNNKGGNSSKRHDDNIKFHLGQRERNKHGIRRRNRIKRSPRKEKGNEGIYLTPSRPDVNRKTLSHPRGRPVKKEQKTPANEPGVSSVTQSVWK